MTLSVMVFIVDFAVLWWWSIVAEEMGVVVFGGSGRHQRRLWRSLLMATARADEGKGGGGHKGEGGYEA